MQISQRAQRVQASQTVQLDAQAKALLASGKPVINLTAGELDFSPIPEVVVAAQAAATTAFRYTPVAGIPELKQVVADYLQSRYSLQYSSEQILVTNGGKQALYTLCQALIEPGNEVIVLQPGWVSYTEQIQLAGGTPVLVNTNAQFHIDIAAIEQTISSSTVGIMLNSPNNPTGAVYTAEELQQLAGVVKQHNLWVVSDEIYSELVYSGEHVSIAAFAPEHTVIVNGLSKAAAITGWRVGYMAGPVELIERCTALQSQISGNTNNLAQAAAVTALQHVDASAEMFLPALRERREYVLQWMQEHAIHGSALEGAFYAWLDLQHVNASSVALAERILQEANVATVPGLYFGLEGYIRISYARPLEEITEALKRIEHMIK